MVSQRRVGSVSALSSGPDPERMRQRLPCCQAGPAVHSLGIHNAFSRRSLSSISSSLSLLLPHLSRLCSLSVKKLKPIVQPIPPSGGSHRSGVSPTTFLSLFGTIPTFGPTETAHVGSKKRQQLRHDPLRSSFLTSHNNYINIYQEVHCTSPPTCRR